MTTPVDRRAGRKAGKVLPALTYWDLSTSHVTPGDLERITASARFCGYAYPEGAFISLDPLLLDADGLAGLIHERYSPAFVTILDEAVRAGVSLIRFDADAPVAEGLPLSESSWNRPRRRRPMEYWPADCEEQSQQEGWLLTNDGRGLVTVSRIDVPADHPQLGDDEPKFASDSAAYAFVVQRAIAGSRLHLLALVLCHHPVDEAMELPPPDALLDRDQGLR